MTIREFRCGFVDLAKEHWWNGAGAAVMVFLITVFIWKRPDNDYLLYAALFAVIVHSYISNRVFERKRSDRKHVDEIAVAYREYLKLQETISHGPPFSYQSASRRNGSTPHSAPRLVALTGRPAA